MAHQPRYTDLAHTMRYICLLACAAVLTACQVTSGLAPKQAASNTLQVQPEVRLSTHVQQRLCADFLKNLQKKPAGLEFVGCSAGFYEDMHSVIANYRTSGAHAFAIQEYLHGVSNMPRLIKDCCIWESIDPSSGTVSGVLVDGAKRYYIRMKSSELRLGWGVASDLERINNFDVQVIHPLSPDVLGSHRLVH